MVLWDSGSLRRMRIIRQDGKLKFLSYRCLYLPVRIHWMKTYKSRLGLVPGTSYSEVINFVRREYHTIQKRTPLRQAYVRSVYFRKDKIFVNQYFEHLKQKNAADRLRRLRFFSAAIDTIRNCPEAPIAMQNPNKADETLYRYSAETKDGKRFAVQIRENKVTRRKDFVSAFPRK